MQPNDPDPKKNSGRSAAYKALTDNWPEITARTRPPADDRCPRCGQPVAGIEARGPADRRARPCGHRVSGVESL